MFNVTNKISGWGNYPVCDALLSKPGNATEAATYISSESVVVPRGNGRSYGDAAIGSHIISSLGLNRIISLDKTNCSLTCQSGVLLVDVLNHIVTDGFFLDVVPGTKFITMGGAIAADVHGKNHYCRGSFSKCVSGFRLITESGQLCHCSPTQNSELFYTTFGAMGLTGFITEVDLILRKIDTTWIETVNVQCSNLKDVFSWFGKELQAEYKIAWYDVFSCKAICTTGRHLKPEELDVKIKSISLTKYNHPAINVPIFTPSWVVNRFAISIMNLLRLLRTGYGNKQQVGFDSFFFPLDAIDNWSRLYGKQGFIQFQYAVPAEYASSLTGHLLNIAKSKGIVCTLAVIKQLGPGEDKSPLSFPFEGFTVALDFKNQEGLPDLVQNFAEVVAEKGGRVYLAKDACMNKKAMLKGYPQLALLREVVNRVNSAGKFNSNQCNRIGYLYE